MNTSEINIYDTYNCKIPDVLSLLKKKLKHIIIFDM